MIVRLLLALALAALGSVSLAQPPQKAASVTPLPPAQASAQAKWSVVPNDGAAFEYLKEGDPPVHPAQSPDTGYPLEGTTLLGPSDKVKCLNGDCRLRYFDPNSNAAVPFRIRAPLKKWTKVLELREAPPRYTPPAAGPMDEKQTAGRSGGREKAGPTCEGSIAMQEPACDEVIDPEQFRVKWTSPNDESGRAVLTLEPLDLRQRVAPFEQVVQIQSELLDSPEVRKYLDQIRQETQDVSVQVTLERSDRLAVTRIIIVPSLTARTALREAVESIPVQNELLAAIMRMELALERRMWTLAAREALRIRETGGVSRDMLSYRLVGLCSSGYVREREEALAQLNARGGTALCARPALVQDAKLPVDGAPPAQPGGKPKRVGRALLIGNIEYDNARLQAVEQDVREFKATLKSLGFETEEVANLASKSDFKHVVTEFLEKPSDADDIILVYFSGHGMQIPDDQTYLLGTKFSSSVNPATAAFEHSLGVNDLITQLQRKRNCYARVVIVDACRRHLFMQGAGSSGDGVSMDDGKKNTFVFFASQPGKPAAARTAQGLGSPFTTALNMAFQSEKGGLPSVFLKAAHLTSELNPGQLPVLKTSNKVEPILAEHWAENRLNARTQELLETACNSYRGRAWADYVAQLNEVRVLSTASPMEEKVAKELAFASRAQAAERASMAGSYAQAAQQWEAAVRIQPARRWARLELVLAWLMNEDIEAALNSLCILKSGPTDATTGRAQALWQELQRGFPAEATAAAARPMEQIESESAECLVP